MAKNNALLKSRPADVQVINDLQGHPAFAVLPWADFKKLTAGLNEDAMLIAAGNAARGEETFPALVAERIAAGESTVKVIREWRGLTQQQLADQSGVAKNYISQIERGPESGGRSMGHKTAVRLARVLGASVDALMM